MKDYIEFSDAFRKSKGSHESVGRLYDLLHELKEKNDRTKQEDLILSNVYSLLGFHKSAYDLFETIADKNNRKDSSKLFVMKEKAESHHDNFIIKDIRKSRQRNEQAKLEMADFKVSENTNNTFTIKKKKIVIFNKFVKNNDVKICLPDNQIGKYGYEITAHLNWLAGCEHELTAFYNNTDFEDKADKNWYDTLEVYRINITIDPFGNIYSYIVCGDDFWSDHILDVEINNREIESMTYDG
jgi:hypothetical protein